MANMALGQSITGAFTTDDPQEFGFRLDQYDFTGLDDFRQLTINLTASNIITPLLISLIDTKTGTAVASEESRSNGQGKISLSGATFPGANYRLLVGGQSGDYTISTVDGGKVTSIVSTTQGQGGRSQGIVTVGTVGASGKFFPLAASTLAFPLLDVALAASGQFYGIGESVSAIGNVLYQIDPRKGSSEQVSYAGGSVLTAQIKDTQGNKLSGTIDAIEFANNKLYALDRTTTGDKLYTIDPTSRVATLVGDLPIGLMNKGGDLVYDATNNRFLVTAEGTPTSDALWQIPLANPAGATRIGLIGFTGVTALDFENGQLTEFDSGTSPHKININTTTGFGTLGQAISGILKISGATTIVGTVTPPAATNAIGTKSQSFTQRTIDLTDYAGQALKLDVVSNGDAAYTNNIGFYAVEDALTGTIKLTNGTTLKPGDANYAVEAVKRAVLQVGKIDSKLGLDITGGQIYAPVVVAQGTLTDFVNRNPTNGGNGNVIHAYFNYIGANPDNFDHFRLTGANTFAVEDLYGGGDRDFNDLIVSANFRTA
jgi:Domain of unknown function (DUF4114)